MNSGSPTKYLFLLAASHSGSTLSALLLNSHPQMATVGELTSGAFRTLEGYRCSCRELLTECPFWRRVGDQVRRSHPEFNLSNFGVQFQLDSPSWLARVLRAEHRGRLLETVRDAVLTASPLWREHVARTGSLVRTLAGTVLAETGANVL